jgi:hypothetical protein
VAAVVESPTISRLTCLGLGVVCREAAAADRVAAARAIAESPHVGRLTTLHLFRDRIGDEGVRALAASPHLANLTDLDLYENDLTDASAQALYDSAHLKGLRRLCLTPSNQVSDRQKAQWRKRLGKNFI